jgi:hypothetical protein
MLHPRLAEFVRITKRHGLECHLSSNLNILRNIDDVLAANPDYFRISLSGFTQATYGTTHVRGDIEQVKRNMRELSEAKRRARGCRTRVTVYFHKYRDNLQDLRPMREYATSLGFEWLENWAYYMPLERVLELVDGTATAEAREFVDTKFALPIVSAIREAKRLEGDQPCTLLQNQLTLDHRGNVNLCCAVYDFDRNRLGAFLDMSEADLERATNGHPTCDACASRGLHRYFTYSDSPALKHRFEELTAEQLPSADASGPPELTLTN